MSTPYNMAFACFSCRKSFKREMGINKIDYPSQISCIECGGTALNLGRHFKAPKKEDVKQWKKVEFLVENGFRFQKIRPIKNSLESVPYPETLQEAKEFVIKYKEFSIK